VVSLRHQPKNKFCSCEVRTIYHNLSAKLLQGRKNLRK
jgi:hypothetical protein